MKGDTVDYVSKCLVYQQLKIEHQRIIGSLQSPYSIVEVGPYYHGFF